MVVPTSTEQVSLDGEMVWQTRNTQTLHQSSGRCSRYVSYQPLYAFIPGLHHSPRLLSQAKHSEHWSSCTSSMNGWLRDLGCLLQFSNCRFSSRDWMFICWRMWQKDSPCYGLNVWGSPLLHCHSYINVLTPRVTVLGGGALGRWLDPESEVFMNGSSAHIREAPESSLPPSAKWGHSRKNAVYEMGRHRTCWRLDLELPNLQNSEK